MEVETHALSGLMERYATGDERAFEPLYRLLSPRLYGFCRRMAANGPEGDDLFQETLLKLHRARATYVTGANVLHWSFAIARSIFLTRLRYRRRHPEELGAATDIAQHAGLQPADESTPEAQVLAEDQLDIAVRELQRMSEKNRIAYILIKDEGLSAKEAAAILGTTPAVVKQRAHRAYQQLRNALGADERSTLENRYEFEPS
jgi:RNA polymerase sigma-70 factor, ECF subfamily